MLVALIFDEILEFRSLESLFNGLYINRIEDLRIYMTEYFN